MQKVADKLLKKKFFKCEKNKDGSLNLVVEGDGDVLDCIESMLSAEDFCFEKAERKNLLEMDPYKEVHQNILDFLANQVYKDIERINDRGEDVHELRDDIKARINLLIESINNEQNALKDGLTDLYNRKFLNGVVRNLFEENIHRNKPPKPVSVIMFDADHFKKVNDTYGHQAGDQVLITMSKMMKNFVREGDFCARYGGEEFTFVLFNCNKENAVKRGDQFRKMVESFKIEVNQGGKKIKIPITVSMGVATYTHLSSNQQDDDIFSNLINEADNCMYASKENDRNNLAYCENGEVFFTKNTDNTKNREKSKAS